MIPLNDDGSLDIERINNLPFDEYMDVMGDLSQEQLHEYLSRLPKQDSNEPMQAVKVNYGCEDVRSGVDADILLANLRGSLINRCLTH